MESVDNASSIPTSPKQVEAVSQDVQSSSSPKKVTGLPLPIATLPDPAVLNESVTLNPVSDPGNIPSSTAAAPTDFKPRYIRTGM